MTPATAFDDETRALLALHLVPGIGTRLTEALVERFGSAAKALAAPVEELGAVPRLGAKRAQQIAKGAHAANVEKELALLVKHQVRLLRLHSPDYPSGLSAIGSPPAFLYVRGTLRPADENAVAIVGSRAFTAYGQRMTERLAADLVRAGYTVVSGLARGIDGFAHRAALDAGGRTLAVLAGGLAKIYPPEHAELSELVAKSGALISEAAMAQGPLRTMFPARNRIISGLSRGVVVVEAGDKSGALITAEHALKQGRPVFAVPGPADSDASRGTLRLIKKGAVLVRDVDDILGEFGQRPAGQEAGVRGQESAGQKLTPPAPVPKITLTPPQKKVWDILGSEPVHADDIVQRSELSVAEVSHALLLMELQGQVRRLPGNRFERKG